jgi:hypothetical protein
MRQPIARKPTGARRPAQIAGAALSVATMAAVAWFLVGPRATAPPPASQSAAVAVPPDTVQQELEAARQAQRAAAEEASRLRAEAEARRKADEEGALRRRIEDEFRQKAEAEQAARQKADEEQRRAAAEAAKAEAAKAEADRARAEAQKKVPPPAPAQMAASSAAPGGGAGASQCDGTFRSQWCRGAYRGFPESCWYVPMTIRNGALSGQWTSQGAAEPQTFNGQVAPDGTVSITYNLIGTQSYVGQHFTAILTGSVAGGVLSAKGRAGETGREFSVRVQCR